MQTFYTSLQVSEGHIISETQSGETAVYTDDSLNPLTIAKISGGTERYAYAATNQRVWRGVFTGTCPKRRRRSTKSPSTPPGGAKLAMYRLPLAGYSTTSSSYDYFGGKMIRKAQGRVNPDRLGSIGKYFPYGQERPSATAEGTEKFATYFRDENTGLDYAQNRYHKPGEGRFMSPDPYLASGGPGDPGSWNRYAYVGGNPVNGNDPLGLATFPIEAVTILNNLPRYPSTSITVTAVANLTSTTTLTLPGSSLRGFDQPNAPCNWVSDEYVMMNCVLLTREEACSAYDIACPGQPVPPAMSAHDCFLASLQMNGVALFLDAVGVALPGGNGLATNLSQIVIGFAGTINAAVTQESFIDTVSALGNLLNVQVHSYAWSLSVIRGTAGYVPFLGNFLAGLSAVGDVYAA
jgi:RHS repeat-associated protein